MIIRTRRRLAPLLILLLLVTGVACAGKSINARQLALGGLRAQQTIDQLSRSTESLYTQKVIGNAEAQTATGILLRATDAHLAYTKGLTIYLATRAEIDGLSASAAFAKILAVLAELARSVTTPGLKAQVTAELDKARPTFTETQKALPQQ